VSVIEKVKNIIKVSTFLMLMSFIIGGALFTVVGMFVAILDIVIDMENVFNWADKTFKNYWGLSLITLIGFPLAIMYMIDKGYFKLNRWKD
tara:strand:- start:174 stop:446 length:273 start_codon:yes stop_codon:yes gene_type:complete